MTQTKANHRGGAGIQVAPMYQELRAICEQVEDPTCAVCGQPIEKPDCTYLVPLDERCRALVDACYEQVRFPDYVAVGRSDLLMERNRAVELARTIRARCSGSSV